MTIIETERLRLRPLDETDLAPLQAYMNDWDVAQWTATPPFPYSEEDGKNFIAAMTANHANGHASRFGIALREDDVLIGGIGVEIKNNLGTLGYWLGTRHWGRGYATEAVRAILDHAFANFGLERIDARTDPNNQRSQDLLMKIGLVRLADLVAETPTRRGANSHCYFTLPAATWRQQRSNFFSNEARHEPIGH